MRRSNDLEFERAREIEQNFELEDHQVKVEAIIGNVRVVKLKVKTFQGSLKKTDARLQPEIINEIASNSGVEVETPAKNSYLNLFDRCNYAKWNKSKKTFNVIIKSWFHREWWKVRMEFKSVQHEKWHLNEVKRATHTHCLSSPLPLTHTNTYGV